MEILDVLGSIPRTGQELRFYQEPHPPSAPMMVATSQPLFPLCPEQSFCVMHDAGPPWSERAESHTWKSEISQGTVAAGRLGLLVVSGAGHVLGSLELSSLFHVCNLCDVALLCPSQELQYSRAATMASVSSSPR